MNSFTRLHDGASHSLVWTEQGIVSGGIDASLLVTSVSASTCAASVTRTLSHGHPLGYAHVAANHALTRIVAVALNGDVQLWNPEAAPASDPERKLPGPLDERPALVRSEAVGVDLAHTVVHSPIAPQYATGGVGGRVSLWDALSGRRLASVELPGGHSPVLALAFAPDGTRLAAACSDGSVHIIEGEPALGEEENVVVPLGHLARLAAHALPVRGVAFSHDGHKLFTASDDSRVGVWDASAAASGSLGAVSLFTGHAHWATAVAAAPDKHLIASVSADRTCRLWDVRTREAAHVYTGHTDRLWAVGFDPTGMQLATVSDSGTLGVFSVAKVI